MRTSLFFLLLLAAGCGSVVQPECQMLPSAQGGYVLHLTRTAAAAAGCDAQNPDETSDVWVFDTLANSQVRAHSVSMPYPDPPVDPLPPNLIGAGQFTSRQADSDALCHVASLTTMSDGSGATLLSYTLTNLEALGSAAYQNAEFKADVTLTSGTCTADYTVQALSPAVPCESDADCDPFKQPFSSGIFSTFDQGCHKDAWTAPVTAYLGSSGVCFFNKPYPSLK
ncbi:MAG TPA: hypothetical protein VMH40_05870 [Myxococcaceae bacterium]|nr:hypothetical protein [Myxococcaceae bacterium]